MTLVNPFSLYRSFAFAGILFLRMGSCSQHQMLRREIRGDASQQEPQPEALHQRSTPPQKQPASTRTSASAHRTAPPEEAASSPPPPPPASSTSFTQMKTGKTETTRQSTTQSQGDKWLGLGSLFSSTVSSTTPAPPSLRQAAREYVLGVNSLQTRYEASAREAHNADEVRQQVGHDLVNAGQEYQKADRKFRESVKQASKYAQDVIQGLGRDQANFAVALEGYLKNDASAIVDKDFLGSRLSSDTPAEAGLPGADKKIDSVTKQQVDQGGDTTAGQKSNAAGEGGEGGKNPN